MSLKAIVKLDSLHCVDHHKHVTYISGRKLKWHWETVLSWKGKSNGEKKITYRISKIENGCKRSEKTDSALRAKTSTHFTEKKSSSWIVTDNLFETFNDFLWLTWHGCAVKTQERNVEWLSGLTDQNLSAVTINIHWPVFWFDVV